ncbi:hypothetical protein [Plastoroseomonas arctica]|uniref:Uncharacterized protein n=1 Tax=Plastoroseomonas arctica TaxID=1509237 RepID=A0AAF1KUQ2_9PROT|nr:hypothetical protein [Plastoroseomonas arctica]MBR0656742.1 hypothetical protein [Plastoroseomonas arctica]
MPKTILIIGEDPAEIDFDAPGTPKDVSAETITSGLEGSVARLRADGYVATLLLTRDPATLEEQVREALDNEAPDVVVIGAGLRILPALAAQFEQLMNVLHEYAPNAKLAFNSQPGDSDIAARRWV